MSIYDNVGGSHIYGNKFGLTFNISLELGWTKASMYVFSASNFLGQRISGIILG